MDQSQVIPEQLRHFYGLELLPGEGGLFKQTYPSPERINQEGLPER